MRQSFHVARLSARIDGVGLCSQSTLPRPARQGNRSEVDLNHRPKGSTN